MMRLILINFSSLHIDIFTNNADLDETDLDETAWRLETLLIHYAQTSKNEILEISVTNGFSATVSIRNKLVNSWLVCDVFQSQSVI